LSTDNLLAKQGLSYLSVWCSHSADPEWCSNPQQVKSFVLLPGMTAITNTGVILIVVSEEQVEKTKKEGFKENDFRVCVGMNHTTKAFEAVLVADDDRLKRYIHIFF